MHPFPLRFCHDNRLGSKAYMVQQVANISVRIPPQSSMASRSDRPCDSWSDDSECISNEVQKYCHGLLLHLDRCIVQYSWLVVVVLRCWALYDRKPWVLKFLVSFLILMTGPCIFVLKRQADANQYLINTLPEILPGCIVVYTPYAWVPYTFALVFESLVFSMMLYKTYIITQKYGNTPLIRRLLIDGTLYYVVAIIAVIFCLWAATTNYLRTPVISSGLLVSVLSAMCSRMILSLYNFTGQDQVERLAPSAVGPDSIFSVRPKMAGTFGTDEENCRKLVITEGSMDHMSVEHEVTSFKVGGGLNDNYREIEMSVLHVPQRTGTNVWLSRSALQDTLTI
ncbi:hypothetical protein RSAG8_03767, partial [Rhizoctonia solani AG-8 WAC10335]